MTISVIALLASVRNKRKKHCSLVFFYPKSPLSFHSHAKGANCMSIFSQMPQDLCHKPVIFNVPWPHYFMQTDMLKIFEQEMCVSSRNGRYVVACHDLARSNSDVDIWVIRDGLMGWYVGRTVFSQSIKSHESHSQYGFSTGNWCCSGHIAVGESIRKAAY